MKKDDKHLSKSGSLLDAHRRMNLPDPKHPLISMPNFPGNPQLPILPPGPHVLQFYKIAYKTHVGGKVRYGQHYYDFDQGGLLFASPGQIIGSAEDDETGISCSDYTLLIHPDFFWNYPLAKKLRQYGFFSYSANEVLHLSEEEKETVLSILKMINAELNSRIDDFSQDVIISHIELLLNYANRFYKRQFITRKAVSNDMLQELEDILENHFNAPTENGLPTVQFLADKLHISPSYLSDMLRSLTGQNAQQHIHNKLIEKAKEQLSTTNLTVGEIAFRLGFEHSQSFSKLFKSKTNRSPLEFRKAFN